MPANLSNKSFGSSLKSTPILLNYLLNSIWEILSSGSYKLLNFVTTICDNPLSQYVVDDMGSKQATEQVHNDSQTLGKYPTMARVRVQLPTEQPHELRILIN